MAIALVAHTVSGTNSGGTTSSGINTTGADLITLGVAGYQATSDPTVSDSKGNTYTPLTQKAVSSGATGRIYYCKNATVGTGHTFTASGTNTYAGVAVAAWSGSDLTAPFDQENGATSSSTTTIQPGSVTPTTDGQLVVTLFTETSQRTGQSVDSPFTVSDGAALNPGNTWGIWMAYEIQTTATARNPTWTWVTAASNTAEIATFKAAAAGGAGHPAMRRLLNNVTGRGVYMRPTEMGRDGVVIAERRAA